MKCSFSPRVIYYLRVCVLVYCWNLFCPVTYGSHFQHCWQGWFKHFYYVIALIPFMCMWFLLDCDQRDIDSLKGPCTLFTAFLFCNRRFFTKIKLSMTQTELFEIQCVHIMNAVRDGRGKGTVVSLERATYLPYGEIDSYF